MLTALIALFAAGTASADSFELSDGAREAGSVTELTSRLDAVYETVVVILDGEELALLENTDTVDVKLDAPLAIGAHSAELICLGEAGNKTQTFTFKIVKSIEKILMDDNMDSAPKINSTEYAEVNTSACGTAEDGSEIRIAAVKINGKSEGDSALAFVCPIDRTADMGVAQPNIYLHDMAFSGEITVETDVFFSAPTGLSIESRSDAGFGFPFAEYGKDVLEKSGTIRGSSMTYPIGEWFNLKMIIDLGAMTGTLKINDEPAFENVAMGEKVKDFTVFKIQPSFYEATAGQYVAFDNMKITSVMSLEGFSEIRYKKDGEFVTDALLAADSDEFMLCGADILQTADDISDKIRVYSDGREIAVSEAEITENAELRVKLERAPGTQKKIKVVLSGDIEIFGGDTIGNNMLSLFDTAAPQVYLDTADFRINSVPVLSGYQLREGKLAVNAFLTNTSAENKNVTVVLAVYSNGEMIAAKAYETDIAAGKVRKRCAMNLTFEPTGKPITAECFIADSLASRIAYSKKIAK